MSRNEFIWLLKAHDWHYQRSDDHGAWARGKKERDEINHAKKRNVDLEAVFINFYTNQGSSRNEVQRQV